MWGNAMVILTTVKKKITRRSTEYAYCATIGAHRGKREDVPRQETIIQVSSDLNLCEIVIILKYNVSIPQEFQKNL